YEDVKRHEPHRRHYAMPADLSFGQFLEDFGHFWGLRRQTFWLMDWSGNIQLDLIARFERLDEDWRRLPENYSNGVRLPKCNAAPVPYDWRSYYDSHLKDLVYNRYREEIELFGYDFK
ncbi:MAG: hypothetical protein R3245_00100, partial [Kiloniellales bacterium]|nr:hypothetical protein [Kiloniellales bacterium]